MHTLHVFRSAFVNLSRLLSLIIFPLRFMVSIAPAIIPTLGLETDQRIDSLEGARSHILNTGKVEFDEAHAGLVQKFTVQKAKECAFREKVMENVQAISAPLINEKLEIVVQHKSRRPFKVVVEIGDRVKQFKQTIETEENKLEDLWKQYYRFRTEFLKFLTQIFGANAIGKPEEDEGYRTDMMLLDADYSTQITQLLEELDEVGQEAIKKMKASEKVYDYSRHSFVRAEF